MINSENNTFSESALPYVTDWNAINWLKVEKYVNNFTTADISSYEFERIS